MAANAGGKWFISLQGEQLDLDEVSKLASESEHFSVEKESRDGSVEYRFYTQAFDGCSDAHEVQRVAETAISQVNAALIIEHGDHKPVGLGNIGKIHPGGGRGVYIQVPTARFRMRFGRVTTALNGVECPAVPSPASIMLSASKDDPAIARVLMHIAEDTWSSLYRAWEVMRKCTGDGKNAIVSVLNLDPATVVSFRDTANYEPRHDGLVAGWRKPARVMPLQEARRFIQQCARAWVEHITSETGRRDRNDTYRLPSK